MSIISEFLKSPFATTVGPSPDGLVEPGQGSLLRHSALFSAPFDATSPLSPTVGAVGGDFDIGGDVDFGDGFDQHFMTFGADSPEGYIGEMERQAAEFGLSAPSIRERVLGFRDRLWGRPWFRIVCDTKLMIDESRAAWADRRRRILETVGLRRPQASQIPAGPHGIRPFPRDGMGDFASPSGGPSSEIADAIRSLSFGSHSSYEMGRAIRSLEQTLISLANRQGDGKQGDQQKRNDATVGMGAMVPQMVPVPPQTTPTPTAPIGPPVFVVAGASTESGSFEANTKSDDDFTDFAAPAMGDFADSAMKDFAAPAPVAETAPAPVATPPDETAPAPVATPVAEVAAAPTPVALAPALNVDKIKAVRDEAAAMLKKLDEALALLAA